MEISIIDQTTVEEVLGMDACIRLMRQAFLDLHRGNVISKGRDILFFPSSGEGFAGGIGTMAAYRVADQVASIKVAGVFPENSQTERDVHQGSIALFDRKEGRMVALCDMTHITAIRTAALSAVATGVLSRRGSSTLAVFGAGVQAYWHVNAVSRVRDIKKVNIINRSPDRMEQLVSKLSNEYDFEIKGFSQKDAGNAIKECDILCMTTSSPTPVLEGNLLPPGCHVNAIGSSIPATREIDDETVLRSTVFVDEVETALREAGDIVIPAKEHPRIKDKLKNIAEAIEDPSKGRASEEEITLFKSVGMSIQDLYCAHFVYDELNKEGKLNKVFLGGKK